jgi:hypothetical protein
MYCHLAENPCLYQTWQEIWSNLQTYDWEKVDLSKEELNIEGSLPKKVKKVYALRQTGLGTLKPGVHVFASKMALLKYIARFPYLLQDRNRLKATLKAHGWNKQNRIILTPAGHHQ